MSPKNASYRQIVKSTSIFGGSQIITIFIGFIRTKIIAILLGATGIGLISIYQSIIDMIRSISVLGIDTSGVKDIATANASGDQHTLEKKVAVFKWWVKATAILGAFICILFAYPISDWAFDQDDLEIVNLLQKTGYIVPILLLSVCIFFTILSMGQSTIMQGMRQISYMVKSTILGNLFGLLFSIPLFWFFGASGIIPSLIVSSLVLFCLTSYYANKINIASVRVSSTQAFHTGLHNLKLGLFIVSAAICNTASMFIIRSFLSHQGGLETVGLFQSAWTITSIYLMLILRSMGSDFFPRLCTVSHSNIRVRRLVNEQTYIVLIISTPIIIGMLLLSAIVLPILYSTKFSGAESLLQWQILGTYFKVLSWPLGFILLAKGKGLVFFLSEVFFFLIYLGGSFFLFHNYALQAVGIAYLIAYFCYLILLLLITVKICKFRWKVRNLLLSLFSLMLIAGTFCILQFEYSVFIGIVFLLISSTYSATKLNKIFRFRNIWSYLKSLR